MEVCKAAADCDEVLFSPDGSWTPLGSHDKVSKPVKARNDVAKQSSSQNLDTVKQQLSITKIREENLCLHMKNRFLSEMS